jgi:glycosyltransferase involved in cell wall biosynthesis
MNIWVLQIGEPVPLDPSVRRMRSALLNEELVKRGHSVLWWTSSFDHVEKRWRAKTSTTWTLAPSYQARLLKGTGYRKNVSLSRSLDHRYLAMKLRREVRGLRCPDIFVIGMPDYHLASVAVSYCREFGVPCIVDIRDQWPDILLDRFPAWATALGRLLLHDDFRKLKSLTVGADSLVAMSEDLLDWALRVAERPRRSLDAVYPLGSAGGGVLTEADEPGARLKRQFVVTYVGSFGDLNHPAAMVQAARLLHKRSHGTKEPPVFVLAGDGPRRSRLQAAAAGLPNVLFPGWIDSGRIPALLSSASVAVLPWHSRRPAFPNKAVTYLECSLPILNEAPGQLADLLTEYGAGVSAQPLEAEWLADRITHLHANPEICVSMSKQARQLWADRLDRAWVYPRFADHVEAVARGRCDASA